MTMAHENEIRRSLRLRGATRAAGLMTIDRWRGDWNLFVREAFSASLDEEQRRILRSVQECGMVSVVSGTSRGKDFVAACAALCFLYLTPRWRRTPSGRIELYENTKVALTAPTERQVKNIMFPEISRLFQRAAASGVRLTGRLAGTDIRMPGTKEWFLTGFKADENNHEAWSGFHAVHTMFVVTEATGIGDGTFYAIEGNLQGDSRLLIVFNPNTTVGYAAESQKSPRFEKFRLNSLTAPNVVRKSIVVPGQVDYDWVADKVSHWCVPISKDEAKESEDDFEFEGAWYRPSDLFRKKVLGTFPHVGEDALIPERWVRLAQERWTKGRAASRLRPRSGGVLGVDVAGMGRDCTVRCFRYGNTVEAFEKQNSGGKAEHMLLAGKIWNDVRAKGLTASIDTIGEGAGVYARLQELSLESGGKVHPSSFISCKFSSAAKSPSGKDLTDVTGQYTFANMRAYLFWAVRDWLNPDNNTGAALPPGGSFMEEATAIRWMFLSSGKIIIEPKEDIKKRLGRSTDEFDALANTFHPAVTAPRYTENDIIRMFG